MFADLLNGAGDEAAAERVRVSSGFALTARQHERTLAHAVVVVHVLGAEVGAVDHQAALPARRPTVAFQEEPGGKRNGVRTWGHDGW